MSFLFAQPNISELHNVVEDIFSPASVAASENPMINPDTTPYANDVPVDFRQYSLTWEQLWSFGNMGETATDGGVFLPLGEVEPRVQNADQHGIAPVLVHARMAFGLRVKLDGQVYVHVRPLVVIGNPYGVDMAGAEYHIRLGGGTGLGVYREGVDPAPERGADAAFDPPWHGGLSDLFGGSGAMDFRIPASESSLSAGEARVFTLPAGTLDQNTGKRSGRKTYNLENNYNELSSVYIDTGITMTPAELNAGGVQMNLWGYGEPIWEFRMDPGDGSLTGRDGILQMFYGLGVGNPYRVFFVDAVHSMHDSFVHWGGGYYMSMSDVQGDREGNPFYEYNLRAIANPYSLDADEPQDRTVSQLNDSFFTNVALEDPNASLDQKLARWGEYNRGSSLLSNQAPLGPGFSKNPSLEWITYDVPRPDRPVASLGFLANLNSSGFMGGNSISYTDRAAYLPQLHQALLPIANAYASVRVPRDSVFYSPNANHGFSDASFLLNHILFDRFTVTTFPYEFGVDADFMDPTDVNRRYQPNAEFDPVAAGDVESRSAASRLLVAGAFNVNSTSVPAWTALLASLHELNYQSKANDDSTPYLRTQGQALNTDDAESGATPAAWSGYRPLSDSEVGDLASAIVQQVKARGPFLSMAAFVNRTLEAGSDSSDPSYAGALQAALDSEVNTGVDDAYLSKSHNKAKKPGNVIYTENRVPNRVVGAPAWLLQSDLLAPLAPILQVRSDTFTIRSMGEVQSAMSGEVNRAWCEATYQRTPEYVESQDDAKLYPPISSTNKKFGRRFVLVDFRWLKPSEI